MPTLYYKITAVNELGESVETTGSYDPELPTGGSIDAGGEVLTFGSIPDGAFLVRSGTTIIGADLPGAAPRDVTTVSGNTTLLVTHGVVLVNTGASTDITITLPSAAVGREYTVKNIGTGTGKVTVDGNGAQTIDGNATAELFRGDKMTIVADTINTNWQTV